MGQKDLAAPLPAVVEALAKAFDRARPPDQIETPAALARAASRLGVLSLKPRVERLCANDNVTLRRAAEEALRAFGSPSVTCDAPKKKESALPFATSATSAASAPSVSSGGHSLSLTFVTDAARLGLTLDPGLAPLAATRIADLARAGFYDGLVLQRVVPGFVVQFGDPIGDGYGGSGKPPLPSETSPLEFAALSVGIAVGGRDTGSSQIFVTLSPDPSLYGDYPLVGWADPEWANSAEGDVIRSVEVKP
jgi:cyclophilin family peptidyl-prolyl cis-trans isomerase